MPEPVMVPTAVPVEDFLETVEPAGRQDDARSLVDEMAALTGQEPVMWGPSIIGFGGTHLVYGSGREVDVPLLAFSPRKAAIVFYLEGGPDSHRAALDRLGPHRESKACVYVTRLSRIDRSVLHEILSDSWDLSARTSTL